MPTISFKVSAEEALQLRRRAREEKITLSAYLRKSALPPPAMPRPRVLKRHPLSGLMVDATPGPVVTMDEIKTSLADFP